jgi:hypothetical protein
MDKKITTEEILTAIVSQHFDDLDFLEMLNNMTYSRKIQLKRKYQTNQLNNGEDK